MSQNEEQFAKDVERALQLSLISAAQESERRNRLVVPITDGNTDKTDFVVARGTSNTTDGLNARVQPGAKPISPSPSAVFNPSATRVPSTSENATVRPRPRPSSTGRSVSPATIALRRSGYIENGQQSAMGIPTTGNVQRRTSTANYPETATLWEEFDPALATNELKGGHPPKSPLPSFDFSHENSTTTTVEPTHPKRSSGFGVTPYSAEADLLNASWGEAETSPNLIALSPTNKGTITKHYNLDLDSLFAVNRPAVGMSGPPKPALRAKLGSSGSTNKAGSPVMRDHKGSAVDGSSALSPRTLTSNNQPRQSADLKDSVFSDLDPIFSNTCGSEGSLPMPTTRAPGLPIPPPIPARTFTNTSKTSTTLQITRQSTPNADLLDLKQGVVLPEVSSVDLFDPLFSPSEEAKKGFEDQFTDLTEQLSARSSYALTSTADDDEYMEMQLQDPFSYDELNMAQMTTKGQDEEEDAAAASIYQSVDSAESGVYETMGPLDSLPHLNPPALPAAPANYSSLSSTKSVKMTYDGMMDEFTAFSVMVARLKAEYRFDDKYTNLGILFSPTVNLPSAEGLTVDLTIYTEMASDPIQFTTDVSTSVEIVMWNVMSNISADFLEFSVDDYILKVYNLSEYLVNDSSLSDYAYVHNCLKLNEDIKFSLHTVSSLNKPFLRKPGDDEEPIYMIKDELHGDRSYKVQPRDLKLLYDVFSKMSQEVNTVALEQGLKKLNLTRLLQSVKAITSVVLGAETPEVKEAIKQLMRTSDEVTHNIHDEKMYQELMDDFQKAMEGLTAGIRNLISMYCATFHVRFTPPDMPSKNRDIKLVTDPDQQDNVLVQVGSVHRIPAGIRSKFDRFKVKVSLYYAGLKACDHIDTEVFSMLGPDRSDGSIYFNQWLELTTFPMSMLPAETRMLFTLCAMNTCQPISNSGRNILNKWMAIAWVSFMFFDFRRNVTQGNKLLSLWHNDPNVMGATGSNIWQPNTILLQINLPDFNFDLRYPPPLPQNVKHSDKWADEQTVPNALAAELNVILAKHDRAMTKEDKHFLWSNRAYFNCLSEALPKVLLSAPQYDHTGVVDIQETLDSWAPLTAVEALRLLLPEFPCHQIRAYAVKRVETMSSDEMCDYLPQLVQALKYESYHDSELARLLLERCVTSVRLAQQLYWSLKEGAFQPAYRERYKLVFGGLVSVMGQSLRKEMELEEALVRRSHELAEKVKQAKSDVRDKVKDNGVLAIHRLVGEEPLRLPTNPGHEVNGLDLKLCNYFNSFTTPLRLVFCSIQDDAPNHYVMYKVGDDLRQDMLSMQLFRSMDKLWLQNGLDLRLITFTVLPTGDKRGMLELVRDSETLGRIQGFSGITGSFKDQPLANWLQKHNPTQADYQRAVENFTLSCAGYCVATYILGIGDRHNDNIMVKRSGHIFHIDFSKFLGDAQKFGSFKRDRTPFILTKDMAYVINGGDKPSQKFQDFVDVCCEAFNCIRDNADELLILLRLMVDSGIKGLTSDAVQYVRNALLPDKTNSEATSSFTRMIEDSLQSKFVQWNFFFHNLAQLKFSSHSDGELLSFIPTTYSMATDGRIVHVEIFDYQKRYLPEKHYIYIIKVRREKAKDSALVYRRYSEFQEFYTKLTSLFPYAPIPKLPGGVVWGRTHVQKVAEKRKAELETFLTQLLNLSEEISQHDIIYTFFHPMIRDETKVTPSKANTFKENAARPDVRVITGEVKMSLEYKHNTLHVMIMHVKGLGNECGDRPNPYVKLYLLPDPVKTSKRKTKVMRSTFHPTYNEMFEYRLAMSEVRQRTLQVTVWSAELAGNEFLGALLVDLFEADFGRETATWYKLSTLHRIKS